MSPVEDCRAGRIPPTVAVARMLLAGEDAAAILRATQGDHPALQAMRALVHGRAATLDALAAQVAATAGEHHAYGATPAEGFARIAAFFDHAVNHSPEASVALYSLGDPQILEAATQEIVAWLQAETLLGPNSDVLDIGCGIGRIAAAIAPSCRSVLGLDVSPGMVAEAARRLAAIPNITLRHTGGEHLDDLETAAFDLVLAIDSFPYVIQAGPTTVARHIDGAIRILRPGGALVILNLSYRGDDAQDRADAAAWAARTGLALLHHGDRPFRNWDGTAFAFTTPSPSGRGPG